MDQIERAEISGLTRILQKGIRRRRTVRIFSQLVNFMVGPKALVVTLIRSG